MRISRMNLLKFSGVLALFFLFSMTTQAQSSCCQKSKASCEKMASKTAVKSETVSNVAVPMLVSSEITNVSKTAKADCTPANCDPCLPSCPPACCVKQAKNKVETTALPKKGEALEKI